MSHAPDLTRADTAGLLADLDGVMHRRGLRLEVRLSSAVGVRASAHIAGMGGPVERAVGCGAHLVDALSDLTAELRDQGQ